MITQKVISNCDELFLDVAIIEPKGEIKGVVQFSHGMSEHKERYFDFMNFLAQNGYVCVIHDHRGHGKSVKSETDLGYFYTKNIDFIVDDLHQITNFIKQKYPNLDVILFSHSMGTLVARNYLKKYDKDISKVVLCGAPTQNKMAGFGLKLAKFLNIFYKKTTPNKFLDKLVFSAYSKNLPNKNDWVCANLETLEKYNQDELCGFVFTTNGFINLFELQKQAFNKKNWKTPKKDLPIFVIAGQNDPVIQSEKKFCNLIEFLHKVGYNNIKSKLYPNMRHEILNEKDNQIVYNDVLNFIEEK